MPSEQGDQQSSSPSQRLPVNPRRHKVAPDQRKRVATACNNCNLRRVKCSGEQPCSHCAAASRECVYPIATAKVSISRAELDDLRRRLDAYEKTLQDVVPDASRRQELLGQRGAGTTSAAGSTPSEASPAAASFSQQHPRQSQQSIPLSPVRTEATATTATEDELLLPSAAGGSPDGRLLHDAIGTGRFHGDTSESAFADGMKALLRSHLPPSELTSLPTTIGRCHTSDARPLPPTGDVDPLWLPPPATIRTIFGVLRNFIQDGAGSQPSGAGPDQQQVSPSGGIYWWGDLRSVPTVPPPTGHPETDTRSHRRLAFYQTALAVACRIASTKPPASLGAVGGAAPSDRSEPYFARAVRLLGNPLDPSRCNIGQVSILTLMAYYLLETDRREAAWLYVGLAVRIGLGIGAHRGFLDERGKRIFWTLYVMDRWLSCLMGRPPNLSDEAMQLPLPKDAQFLPPSIGLRAHIELSRISSHIVCNVFRIDASRESNEPPGVDGALSMLEHWRLTLPAPLQLSAADGLSSDPATCQLHMFHNQLILLTLRQALLAAAKASLSQRVLGGAGSSSPAVASAAVMSPVHSDACVAAALRNMRLARHAATLQQPRRLVHSGLHFVYSAVLCLLLQMVVRGGDGSSDDDDDDDTTESGIGLGGSEPLREVDFAIELFDREAQSGNTYGFTCAATLRELRLLVSRQRGAPGAAAAAGGFSGHHEPMDIEQTFESLDQAASGAWQSPLSAADVHDFSQQAHGELQMHDEAGLHDDVLSWMNRDWEVYDREM